MHTKANPTVAPTGKPATPTTIQANRAARAGLDFSDAQDWADAVRGFIAPLPDNGRFVDAQGEETWNTALYDFLQTPRDGDPAAAAPAPDSVHPSLWRQSQLVMIGGLFKVTDRIYQIRNADCSNMTIVEGDAGLIVLDTLLSPESSAAALALYYAHRPRKPVKHIIISHSHVDHYGGILGVTTPEAVRTGEVSLTVPAGFIEAVSAENFLTGNAMVRRGQYMFGQLLTPSPTGHVGAGLSSRLAGGVTGLITPTDIVRSDGETRSFDGLTFVFLLAPNTEAPAEMHWYIPELRAVTAGENYNHTMHNLYTLRGAKTRDPLAWSRALDATVERFGDAEVLYSPHHWPVWGRERVRRMLTLTSDLYRYINNQTLHLANQGLTMLEIAETLRLPPELDGVFALRGYYGSLSHNVKGVYNFYLGWFDANPAHLNPLPPVEAAKKYVDYMGGADAVLQKAREDFGRGEYRWVAQALDHVVFADPGNAAARELLADALEQLGYQAECAPWRNFYLTGALDLRGLPHFGTGGGAMAKTSQGRAIAPGLYFDYLGIRLDGQRAQGRRLAVRVTLPELQEDWLLQLRNAVLVAARVGDANRAEAERAEVVITATPLEMMAIFEGALDVDQAVADGLARGDGAALAALLELFDRFTPDFALVEP